MNLFQNIGSTELIILAVLILLFFGGKKLPELAKGLGEAIHEFKESAKEKTDEAEKKQK